MKITFKDCLERKRIFRFEPAKRLKEEKLDPKIAEDLNNCMILREDADYKRKFSQKGASATIDAAERFIKAAKEVLNVKYD